MKMPWGYFCRGPESPACSNYCSEDVLYANLRIPVSQPNVNRVSASLILERLVRYWARSKWYSTWALSSLSVKFNLSNLDHMLLKPEPTSSGCLPFYSTKIWLFRGNQLESNFWLGKPSSRWKHELFTISRMRIFSSSGKASGTRSYPIQGTQHRAGSHEARTMRSLWKSVIPILRSRFQVKVVAWRRGRDSRDPNGHI